MLEIAIAPSLEKQATDLAVALIGFDRQVAKIDGAKVIHVDFAGSNDFLTAA